MDFKITISRIFVLFLKLTLFSALPAMLCTPVSGQNSPVTTASVAGTAIPGQQITIAITVASFNNIGSVSLTMDYDNTSIQFVSASANSELLVNGNYNAGDNDLGNGKHRLISGWYGNGTTMPDGAILITYTFIYHSGSALLQWFDDGTSCAYTNDIGNFLNDLPFSAFYRNGMICGILPAPGTISGPAALCTGTTATYSINPIPSATRYVWNIPAGSSIIGNANSNTITLDYPVSTGSGIISVRGENDCAPGLSSTLPVSVLPPPVAIAGPDTTIAIGTALTLHGSSTGTSAVTYHWSPENLVDNPNTPNPRTVALNATTTFTLTVTGNCISTDQLVVTASDILTDIPHIPESGSIEDFTGKDFLLFPNPAKNFFNLRSDYFRKTDLDISVITVTGAIVKNFRLDDFNTGTEIRIDASALKPGIYFIRIDNGIKNVMKRLILL
jgi:hypothetical protein